MFVFQFRWTILLIGNLFIWLDWLLWEVIWYNDITHVLFFLHLLKTMISQLLLEMEFPTNPITNHFYQLVPNIYYKTYLNKCQKKKDNWNILIPLKLFVYIKLAIKLTVDSSPGVPHIFGSIHVKNRNKKLNQPLSNHNNWITI